MQQASDARRTLFTVSKLNRLAKTILESEIGQIWLTAEVSNFVAAASGHWYFTLKDERAQVRAAMFRGANRRVAERPKEGDKVLVRASIGLYEPRGEYQLVVDHLEPEGQGQLKQQFEQLKIKLAAEGLFAQTHKQPLPAHIRSVGIVTSSTGAALHDILTVLQRRSPATKVILYPSLVQGNEAPAQLRDAIETANRRNEVDVLIVGRGGGSLEDLWCFNDEQLARILFASRLPIISAVGHEIDVTISDFVADVRAPTPSAAAELVSTDQTEVMQRIDQLEQRLSQRFGALTREKSYQLQVMQQRLQRNHPAQHLQQQQQTLDNLVSRLQYRTQQRLAKAHERQQSLDSRLQLHSPSLTLPRHQQRQQELQNRLQSAWQRMQERCAQRLASASQLLDSVSPLATLARGYSISYVNGTIVKQTEQAAVGDTLVTKVSDGEIHSQITDVTQAE